MSNHEADEDVKRDICEIGRRVYAKGFVAANDGNISVRTGEDEVWITPTGVSKGEMTPDMLIKVNLEGEVLQGRLKPTSEIKMHMKVYEKRPDIRAVLHVHPPYATAFAIAGIPLNMATMPETVVHLGTIPLAEYATPSTVEVPKKIEGFVADHNGVLLENHGALTWGRDLRSAYYMMESLEFCAKINWIAKQMNGLRELPARQVAELVRIRERMGLRGETPAGVRSDSERNTGWTDGRAEPLPFTDGQLERIVGRITAAVLAELGQIDARKGDGIA
ncbi:L-fuculose-phosphate aldolase [Paenibacillus forsythiae]|uniref:L-fuculose-phosphate aldolase n=1 Tax=Paenibacillus forsythiae TaxID=365616 RepID=A0ABU3H9S5_9BACL|nr:class II aldolase/adducin family protein [Paenibacillus forsythiae]MDT3427587.1 L-fuculose-phosphate aldolase [Paenibacillus forsythiae]